MRNTFHYWFHCGEVNAIRQMLGHPEMIFVGQMIGHLEYLPSRQAMLTPSLVLAYWMRGSTTRLP